MSIQSDYYNSLSKYDRTKLIKLAAKDFRSSVSTQTQALLQSRGFNLSIETIVEALKS